MPLTYNDAFAPTDRGAILAGLRRGGGGRPPMQIPPRQQQQQQPYYANQNGQMQYQAMLAQQQQNELDLMRQTSSVMELQLQQMRLQSLEIQERLLAAAQHQIPLAPAPSPPEPRRRTETFPARYASGPMPMSAGYNDFNNHGFGSAEILEERRDAVQGLQRAHQQRTVSVNLPQSAGPEGRFDRQRLSFGAQTAAESAMARKAFAAAHSTPPSVQGLGREGGQHRHSPSVASVAHSDASSSPDSTGSRTLLSSPTGPTLVLSKPGASYTSSSPPPAHHAKRPSDASSTTSSSSDGASEVASFESVTSVTSSLGGSKVPSLNPAAPSFTPSPIVKSPAVAPYRPFAAKVGPRGAVPVRQPRGPAPDEELPAKNFASRIRRRAIGRVLNRRSFNDLAVEY